MQGSKQKMRAIPILAVAIVFRSLAGPAQEPIIPRIAVGPQYDSTHVYVAPENVDAFVKAFLGTFGGESSKQATVTVTPTPSSTTSQVLQTPVGIVSLFGFKTPIPYPFGAERTGLLVTRLDEAIQAARQSGADLLVEPFPDAIGRDAVIQFPGGVNTQLYWHTTAPSYPALQTIPENRVYVSPWRLADFLKSYLAFTHGKVVANDSHAPGIEVGRPGETVWRVRLESQFGKLTLFVSDGHMPYPYGRETTGYEVANLAETLAKAKAVGVTVLVQPYKSGDRTAAMVEFPGGYVAEIHEIAR